MYGYVHTAYSVVIPPLPERYRVTSRRDSLGVLCNNVTLPNQTNKVITGPIPTPPTIYFPCRLHYQGLNRTPSQWNELIPNTKLIIILRVMRW